MAKKKNAPAARTSISKDIHDLKTLNSDLVKEVAELRKQIELLRSRLDSLTADRGKAESGYGRTKCHGNAAACSATWRKPGKHEKIRKKIWIFYPITITAIFFVSMAVVSFLQA
ncbi:hypothetical protein M5K25_013369 [Dendrobium thyrsiflorum]|uniref:Uncharacterized protein n=1 Tax=Dendrobium thyrsiflorum TaxID=117978 RepID=A0ABD0USW0_DENTH